MLEVEQCCSAKKELRSSLRHTRFFKETQFCNRVFSCCKHPTNFFRYVFTDELIEFIAKQSSLSSVQVDAEKPTQVTPTDVKKFLGVCIYTSLRATLATLAKRAWLLVYRAWEQGNIFNYVSEYFRNNKAALTLLQQGRNGPMQRNTCRAFQNQTCLRGREDKMPFCLFHGRMSFTGWTNVQH